MTTSRGWKVRVAKEVASWRRCRSRCCDFYWHCCFCWLAVYGFGFVSTAVAWIEVTAPAAVSSSFSWGEENVINKDNENDNDNQCQNNDPFVLVLTNEGHRFSALYAWEVLYHYRHRQWQWPRHGQCHGQGRFVAYDPHTGSHLVWLPFPHGVAPEDVLPRPIRDRCQWTAVGLRRSRDGTRGLLRALEEDNEKEKQNRRTTTTIKGPWTAEYLRLPHGPPLDVDVDVDNREAPPSHTATTVLCRLAQVLGDIPAALDPSMALDRLLWVESYGGVAALARDLDPPANPSNHGDHHHNMENDNDNEQAWMDHWRDRPYPYSSALHPVMAQILVDALLAEVMVRSGDDHNDNHTNKDCRPYRHIRLLDPVCGSGTFLAAATVRGVGSVHGRDRNPRNVAGCRENLEALRQGLQRRPGTTLDLDLDVQCADSSLPLDLHLTTTTHTNTTQTPKPTPPLWILAANLPWGANSVDYHRENLRMLENWVRSLGAGVPVALVAPPRLFLQEGGGFYDDVNVMTNHLLSHTQMIHVPPQWASKGRKKDKSAVVVFGRTTATRTASAT